MSFGMIFSIILIIAIIAVAFYAITYFLDLSECAEIGLTYQDLKSEVDKAWNSEVYGDVFSGGLPKGIDEVCFGKLDLTFFGFKEEYDSIARVFRHSEDNLFLYPPSGGCGKESASFNLEHAETSEFFCVPVVEREFSVRLEKGSFDSLVKLSEAG